MWLKAASSNNNPRYFATFYTQCVQRIGGTNDLIFGKKYCIIVGYTINQRLSPNTEDRCWQRIPVSHDPTYASAQAF